jgi:hypothetical protein
VTTESMRRLAENLQQAAEELDNEQAAKAAPTHARTKGEPNLARVTVVAAELGLCERTVRRWQAKGELTMYRKGRVTFVDRNELPAFLAKDAQRASEDASPTAWATKKLGKKK